MKLIKSIICLLIISIFLVGTARAHLTDYGLNETLGITKDGSGNITSDNILAKQETNVSVLIGTVVGALLAFIGILFFILIIYGGFLWMTSRGNEQEVEKAKNLITAATIGLIIVLAAYAITAYIGGALTT